MNSISIVIAVISVTIALISLLSAKSQLKQMESNHIATITTRIDSIEKTVEGLKDNQIKLFDKVDELGRDIGFLQGKLNGDRNV